MTYMRVYEIIWGNSLCISCWNNILRIFRCFGGIDLTTNGAMIEVESRYLPNLKIRNIILDFFCHVYLDNAQYFYLFSSPYNPHITKNRHLIHIKISCLFIAMKRHNSILTIS